MMHSHPFGSAGVLAAKAQQISARICTMKRSKLIDSYEHLIRIDIEEMSFSSGVS